MLGWMLPPGSTLSGRLLSWDADWFIRVASEGYPHTFTYDSGGNLTANELAFFPLYPWLIRLGRRSRHHLRTTSALAVAWLAAVASVRVYALVRRSRSAPAVRDRADRIGYAFVVLFFAQPMSVVLSMGYSESLFVALVAGMFLARVPALVVGGRPARGARPA